MIQKNAHVHKYSKPYTKKSRVYKETGQGAVLTAIDTIMGYACECGATMAERMTRTKV